MFWLKTPHEVRSGNLEDPNSPIGRILMELGGGMPTITGRPMNDRNALAIPAFWAGVRIISEDIASVPLNVIRKTNDGGREIVTDHALSPLLSVAPYDYITTGSWRNALQGHLLLRGNAYSVIHEDGRGNITGLEPIHPTCVDRRGTLYVIDGTRRVMASDMLHIPGPGGNGIDGWSVITLAKNNLSLSQALEETYTRTIATSARPSGFVTQEGPLKPEQADRLRTQLQKGLGGMENAGKIGVFDNGMMFHQLQMTAEDAQFIEGRKFSVTDVARWLNIPPHKIGDLERATFSNVEEMAIEYVVQTLRPWVVRWQQVLDYRLLTERERAQGLTIRFNLNALLQGDVQTRTEANKNRIETGQMTPNEARALEDMPPIEGGDRAFIRLDMVPLTQIDQVQSVSTDGEGRTKVVFREKRAELPAVREYRAPDARLALRPASRPLFLEQAGRLVRGELRDIRRLLKRVTEADLRTALEEYYFDDLPPFARRVMGSAFLAYAESVTSASAAEIDSEFRIDTVEFAEGYTENFVNGYAASSRRALVDLEAEQIESRLQEWDQGATDTRPRHERVADRELVALGDAVARATFFLGGVTTLVWRTLGDSCPYCVRLNGRTVGRREAFIEANQEFEGEGTDVKLIPKSRVTHAPAHRGCDCTIVPGG